jgi:hypothetical protein
VNIVGPAVSEQGLVGARLHRGLGHQKRLGDSEPPPRGGGNPSPRRNFGTRLAVRPANSGAETRVASRSRVFTLAAARRVSGGLQHGDRHGDGSTPASEHASLSRRCQVRVMAARAQPLSARESGQELGTGRLPSFSVQLAVRPSSVQKPRGLLTDSTQDTGTRKPR